MQIIPLNFDSVLLLRHNSKLVYWQGSTTWANFRYSCKDFKLNLLFSHFSTVKNGVEGSFFRCKRLTTNYGMLWTGFPVSMVTLPHDIEQILWSNNRCFTWYYNIAVWCFSFVESILLDSKLSWKWLKTKKRRRDPEEWETRTLTSFPGPLPCLLRGPGNEVSRTTNPVSDQQATLSVTSQIPNIFW